MRSSLPLRASIGIAACIALGSVLGGCNQAGAPQAVAPADTAAATKAIQTLEADMLKAYQSKSAGATMAFYTDDATVITPGLPPASSAGAIMKALAEQFMDPGFSIRFASSKIDVAASGDLAYAQGSFEASHTDWKTSKVVREAGSYVTVFRKQADGKWKAVQDIASPGAAPEPVRK